MKIKTTDITNEKGVGRRFEFDNKKIIYIYKDLDSLMWNIHYSERYYEKFSYCGITKHEAVRIANETIFD